VNPAGAVVIFVLVWWCAFFVMLPIGVKGRWESEEDGVEGADPGAPDNPDLKRKALWATFVALPVAAAVIAVVMSGVLDFRD